MMLPAILGVMQLIANPFYIFIITRKRKPARGNAEDELTQIRWFGLHPPPHCCL